MKRSIVPAIPLFILAASAALAQNSATEIPLPASAYGKAMGVAGHFDRTTSGVYSNDSDLGVRDQAINAMALLPVNHYRTKYVDTTLPENAAFEDALKAIALDDNTGPKADFLIDLRRNCIAPSLEGDPKTVYVNITASTDPNTPGQVTLTSTVCVSDDGSKRPTLKGLVHFFVDGTEQGSSTVGPDDRASVVLAANDSQHFYRAQYSDRTPSDQSAYYIAAQSDCLIPVPPPQAIGCQDPTPPVNKPSECKFGYQGDPIATDVYGVQSLLIGHPDVLANSQVDSRDINKQLAKVFHSIYINDLAKTGWIEGPNEYDNSHNDMAQNDRQWKLFLANYVRAMFAQRTLHGLKSVPVIAPSMGNYLRNQSPNSTFEPDSNSPISTVNLCTSPGNNPPACFDFANTHAYPKPDPSTNMVEGINTAYSMSPTQNTVNGVTKDVYVFQTETGYENAEPSLKSPHPSVSTQVAGKYGPRTLAQSLYTQTLQYPSGQYGKTPGIQLVNFYELIDDRQSCSSVETYNFGLLSVDSSGSKPQVVRKPIYFALQHALQILSDSVDSADLSHVNNYFSVVNGTTVPQHLLLKNSKGTYFVLLWQETPLWDTKNGTEISPDPVTVNIKFTGTGSGSYSYTYNRPSIENTTSWHDQNPRADGSVNVPVWGDLNILKVTPN